MWGSLSLHKFSGKASSENQNHEPQIEGEPRAPAVNMGHLCGGWHTVAQLDIRSPAFLSLDRAQKMKIERGNEVGKQCSVRLLSKAVNQGCS